MKHFLPLLGFLLTPQATQPPVTAPPVMTCVVVDLTGNTIPVSVPLVTIANMALGTIYWPLPDGITGATFQIKGVGSPATIAQGLTDSATGTLIFAYYQGPTGVAVQPQVQPSAVQLP